MITGGKVDEMEIAHKGLLLGVRGRGIAGVPAFREESMLLPPGATLVFYTDGLTDRRMRTDGLGHYSEAEAVEMLRTAVGLVAHEDVEAIAGAAGEAVPGGIDDDTAVGGVPRSPGDRGSWGADCPP